MESTSTTTGNWGTYLLSALLLASQVASQEENEVSPEFLCPIDWNYKSCTCTADKPPNLPSVFCEQTDDHDLRAVFGDLYQTTGFQTLNISHSKLTSLPVTLLKMATFNDIIIRKTSLQRLDTLEGQSNLMSLRLIDNDLQIFNFSLLQNLPSLRHFALTENRHMASIPANAFPYISSLSYLNLSHNGINYIGPNAFANLPNLDILDLSHNRLVSLEPNSFNTSDVHDPMVLVDLSNNNISEVNPDAFTGLKSRSLNMRNNQLTSLKEDQFQSFLLKKIELVSLLVGGNPFTCNFTIDSWLLKQPRNIQRQVIGFRCRTNETMEATDVAERHALSHAVKHISDQFVALISLLASLMAIKMF